MKKLHICLNIAGNSNWMGGAIYTQNLARALASLPEAEKANIKLSVSCSPSNLDLVSSIRSDIDQVYLYGRVYLKICQNLTTRLTFIPSQVFNPLKIDFVYPTLISGKSPYSWGAWIPDFQHNYFPDFFSQQEISNRNSRHEQMANDAPVIILSSQMAQLDFNRLYPKAASRSRVMNFASYMEPEYFEFDPQITQKNYGLPDSFFLISNQFWKHKNHALVIEALGILKQRKIFPTVVCTGKFTDKNNSDYCNYILSRIEELELGSQVRILGLIPRFDQIQLMRRSLAVIQPSLFEGWSTVIEDARVLGKSILASDFPVHLEQNPPHTHFFERDNPEQLALLISEAVSHFKPGPDIEKETTARQKNVHDIQAYAKRFLDIVSSVI